MELKEMIKVMQHFADDGEVEFKLRCKNEWVATDAPVWDWLMYDYRIKGQKQKVTIEKWLCKDRQGTYVVIETSKIEQYVTFEKIKLLETYEVEL